MAAVVAVPVVVVKIITEVTLPGGLLNTRLHAQLLTHSVLLPHDVGVLSISQMGELQLRKELVDGQVARKWQRPEHRQSP